MHLGIRKGVTTCFREALLQVGVEVDLDLHFWLHSRPRVLNFHRLVHDLIQRRLFYQEFKLFLDFILLLGDGAKQRVLGHHLFLLVKALGESSIELWHSLITF